MKNTKFNFKGRPAIRTGLTSFHARPARPTKLNGQAGPGRSAIFDQVLVNL